MTHHLHDNGDLIIGDSRERPLAKLQSEGTFIVTVGYGKHVLDALCGTLTTSDLEAIRDWCERELAEERRLP